MIAWPPRLVAHLPVGIHAKLNAAFLIMVILLVIAGAVSLATLNAANRRAEELVKLQRNIGVYRQLQHDTIAQLYGIASALLVPTDAVLQATVRQLNQFAYDVDRLQYVVAKNDAVLVGQVRNDYQGLLKVVTQVVDLINQGRTADGRELQLAQAGPLADRLERLMNELVNRAEADIVERIEASHAAYLTSRWTVIGFAVGSIALAVILAYAISSSLIGPLRQIDAALSRIAAGDFSRKVEVSNRDELGTLAANLNHMNDELGRLYRQLESANRHKSEFLANISHELRTPLNAIIGFSEVLNERMFGELNAKQAEYVQDIYTSGRHLHALINDILDLAKIEAGRMDLELSSFSLASAVNGAVTLVHERATRGGIRLDAALADNLGEVTADERKLKQILLNLLSNALKFTPAGGRVAVTAGRRDGIAEISVSDTGIGVAPEHQEIIFEEFRQVRSDATRSREGTGLGLALTRKYVEMHGGKIWVRSEPGKGATFTFNFPVQP